MGKMKEISEIFRRKSKRKITRNNSRKPLLENNNNIQAAHDQDVNEQDNHLDQNTFNTYKEQHLQVKEEVTLQELADLLRVPPGDVSNTSEDEFYCSVRPETNSGQQNLTPGVRLIEKSVSEHFPNPPADLDQNLQQHLMNVQNAVSSELIRLGPALESMGLMEYLIYSYHCQTFNHLDSLLQNTSSFKNSFVLLNWALKTYLSKELLGHPDLKGMDPIKKVDLLLLTEWGVKAKDKLLENVQKEVRGNLEKILLYDREQKGCDSDEAYVGLYVDTIKCIAAMPTEAQNISSELSDKVQEVCFQELQIFVGRYKDEQTEVLEKKAKMEKPQMIHFFKTLKTCQELKNYVQGRGKGIGNPLGVEIVKMLENLEAFTLELLKDIVTNITKSHLEDYFSAENKQFFYLITAVRENFAQLANSQDVPERVMDEVYKIIVHSYIEHLIKIKQKKLKKCWSSDVGEKVFQDAKLLHNTMSDLAPGVQKWNDKLLKIKEVLDCKDHDALKLTVAAMQKESLRISENLEFLHKLLRWKGLSKREVREVLDAIPADYQPRLRSGSWYSCLACW